MKIYIELVMLALLGLAILGWKFWETWSLKRILKNYDENKNKSRKPRDFKGRTSGTEQPVESTSDDSDKPEELGGRELLPTTEAITDGGDSSSNRKVDGRNKKKHSRLRNLFKRRRS